MTTPHKADNMQTKNQNHDKTILTSQLSIQPNIPSHMVTSKNENHDKTILTRTNSRRIVSQKSIPTFPTKTLRMKSLVNYCL